MGRIEDNNFATIVNLIEQLTPTIAGGDRATIEAKLTPLVKAMTDEQLQAYIQFSDERVSEAEKDIHDMRAHLAEAEAELKKRSTNSKTK